MVRYRRLPPWVLLAQLFLAAGWQRAVAAHGLDPHWWDGTVISQFRIDQDRLAVEWYRSTMLDGPVAAWPVAIGAAVFAIQLLVGLMLALNVRPLLALAVGAALNVHLVLAGAVNPSIFYLIIGAALALWHIEASVGPIGIRRLTAVSTIVVAFSLGALIPEISTLDPAMVIEDPAIVLCLVAALWMVAIRVQPRRDSTQNFRLRRNGPADEAVVGTVQNPAGDGGTPLVGSRDPTCKRVGAVVSPPGDRPDP